MIELLQRCWVCLGRCFVHKVLKRCILWRKFEGQSYKYPSTPFLTKLITHEFFITGLDNSRPINVKPIFNIRKDSLTNFNRCLTLYICTWILLDFIPCLDSKSLMNGYQWFAGHRWFQSYVIMDGSSSFIASGIQEFVNSFGIEWKINFRWP